MQITRVRAYRVALPLHEGSYKWSGGKSVSVFDSTVVEVETDAAVRFSATDFNSYVTVSTAEGAPRRQHGRMAASVEPGLGVRPRLRVLGKALVEVAAPQKRR